MKSAYALLLHTSLQLEYPFRREPPTLLAASMPTTAELMVDTCIYWYFSASALSDDPGHTVGGFDKDSSRVVDVMNLTSPAVALGHVVT